MNDVAALLLALTVGGVIVRQLLRRGPPIWTIFAAGAFLMVATESLPLTGASAAIGANLPILVFLFSLFLFATALDEAGALEHLAEWILGRARRWADVPLVLFAAFALLSAFILNDALVLIGVPLLFRVGRRIHISPEPLLLTLALSVTVGSVLTPFGNPQNLLVSLDSGVPAPVATFLRYLLLPTLVNIALGGLYLRHVFGRPLARELEARNTPMATPVPFFPAGDLLPRIVRHPVLVIFPVTMIGLITADLVAAYTSGPAIPLYAVALGAALVMLLATPGRSGLLGRVDWSILILFACLFVVVAGAVNGGVVAALEHVFPIPGPGDRVEALGAIILTSVGGPQLVSNVPWVGLQIALLHGLGYGSNTPWAWVALAAGSTLAGNLTLLGAASNLIVVEQAERAGLRIGLRSFIRVGLPLTGITVSVLFVCLWAGL